MNYLSYAIDCIIRIDDRLLMILVPYHMKFEGFSVLVNYS